MNGMLNCGKRGLSSIIIVWIAALFFGILSISEQAHAALSVTSATVNGGVSTTVAPGATITVRATNTGTTNWNSTGWYIGTTAPGTWNCDAAPTPAVSGTNTVTLTGPITAPVTAGTYNIYLMSASNSSCGSTKSSTYTLANSVIVVPPPPTVTSITPTSGPTVGGASVTITGANFTGATSVTIGGAAATGITIVNATTITATTPAGTAGAKNVAVTAPGGTGTGTGLYTYVAPPTVTSITPVSGPTAGGASVTITGTNFTGATSVTIGGAAATGITVVNATTITATTPAGTVGAKNVIVTTPGGTGTGTGLYTYVAPPTVTSIAPNSGPIVGGSSVTITGTNFTGATAVTIGGAAATGITIVNATTITATTPAGTAGVKTVAVTTPGGTGTGTGLYTYVTAPTVTSIAPSSGPTAGGTSVTITGTNFIGATAVTIGGAAATGITVVNATTITATTSAGTAGAKSVAVTTTGGTGTGTGLYTYVAPPTVTSIAPSSGPAAGGTAVTLIGANFTGATAVTIGGADVTGITVVNATTITATTPVGAAGAQDVAVTTIGGTGTGTGLFTYVPAAPSVTTSAATALTVSGATLNGTVSSNGASTAVSFEYGLDNSYGVSVTATGSPLTATATNTAVSAAITGLACGTTYHFRVKGVNNIGTTKGGDLTFTTLACVVTLGKTAGTSAAAVNSYVTFTLTASNFTTGALTNVVMTDVIPLSMTYSTSAATLGAINVSGQTLTWTIAYLPAGGNAQLTLVVQPTTKGSFTNTVTSPGATSASASILILPSAITRYSMDEAVGSWTGAVGEVIDSGGNGLNGYRRSTASPTATNIVSPSPTIASQYSSVNGGFCNAGNFDGNSVVESASSPFFNFTQTLSASAWIYPIAYPGAGNIHSILSSDTNYEFHIDSGGHLYWWWQAANFTSAATIPLNQWTHIAITFDSTSIGGRQKIYINGVQDTNSRSWKGTLAYNSCPFYIGGDISTGTGCTLIPERNFHGMIDEAKIYNYELSAAEVNADMNLGRMCGTYNFDHIRIEHDGSASICANKTVTVKACMDSNCSHLYPGTVTLYLSPSGWASGDFLTLNGGVATVTLSNASISIPSLTLGATSISPPPANGTLCYNGATQNCTLGVGATSCLFDAAETGANPKTHIYTKLAGSAFNVDVLAVGTPATSVDTTKNSTLMVDLVDASSVACPGGTPLNSQQSVTLVSGRKTVSMVCTNPAPSAQVRIRIGSSPNYTYSCSIDKFSVRPSAVTLTSASTLAVAPSPTDTNIIKAGAAFNLGATTNPTSYNGVLMLDSTKLTAQLPSNGSTLQSGGAVGTLAFSPALQANTAQGNNTTYSEVGYFYAGIGALFDTGYTSVDQNSQVTGCAATDTCDCLLSAAIHNGVPDYLSDVPINGRYGCYIGNKASYVFGRFIPDHLDAAVVPTVSTPMACPTGLTCPTSGFVYSIQPFSVQVIAKNLAGGTTANYQGAFAKAVTLTAWDALGSTTTQNPGGSLSNGTIAAAAFSAGIATTTTPTYTLTTVSTAPTNIFIRSSDGEASSLRLANPTTTSVEGGIKVASGHINISNAHGSELLPLSMIATAQYWNGTKWVTSETDNSTSLTFAATNVIKNGVITGTTTPKGAASSMSGGKLTISLSKPGVAGTATINPGAPAYLPLSTGLATFGVYQGKDAFIYMRENY